MVRWWAPALALLTLAVLTTESLSLRLKAPVHIISFGAFLFAFCMTCHGELVLARPVGTRPIALRVEHRIKKLSRAGKW